jgi:2-oxoglutarate ferredoxin oxidoreductase subunit alpha
LTATSGGGFCLMVEAMGLAGMTEIPLVIVEAQRGGPSTGLPTRTEQSDLLFTLYAAHGEFPRIVLAPGTVEQCFEAGWRSFNLAERYQCPVVVLTDQFLSSSLRSLEVDAIDFESVVIDRGKLVDVEKEGVQAGYRRFEMSEDGISPRAFPGHETVTVTASSDEHDERGHITEDSENRVRMMKKRMRKIETARAEMRAPALYGPAGADQTIACWGSTYGACREAVDEMLAEGASINLLQFSDLLPMSGEAVRQTLDACRRVVTVEQNFTSQLGQLLQTTTGRRADAALNKYDGRPFSPGEIISALKELT